MTQLKKLLQKLLKNQAGISLIAMAVFILVLGFLFTAGAQIYSVWQRYEAPVVTSDKIKVIQEAIDSYVHRHGRWPCPASLMAGFDDSEFGLENGADVSDPEGHLDCLTSTPDPGSTGIQVAASTINTTLPDGTNIDKTGWEVITGAVPVRTLGIGDEYIFDGFNQRFIYAVSREYTDPDQDAAPGGDTRAAISVLDGAGNEATEIPGSVVHLVYSMGFDSNGAYGVHGNQIAPCDAGTLSGENCNYASDTEFLNTVNTSDNEQNTNVFFVHQVAYKPPQDSGCVNVVAGEQPEDVSFLLDTSGSMSSSSSGCPAELQAIGAGCSRMDVAHWALRRVIPTRIRNNYQNSADPGETNFTGFRAQNNAGNVLSSINSDPNGITIDNPDADGDGVIDSTYTYDEAQIAGDLENNLQSMCPGGNTPLGVHMDALARDLNADYDADQDGTADAPIDPASSVPRKIVVISDGISNNGENPLSVAQRMAAQYPNIQIDIIDMIGTGTHCYDHDDPDKIPNCTQAQKNRSMQQVTDQNKGRYYPATDPDALLEALLASLGTCEAPTNVTDQEHC